MHEILANEYFSWYFSALIQIGDRAKFDLLLKFHSAGTRIK